MSKHAVKSGLLEDQNSVRLLPKHAVKSGLLESKMCGQKEHHWDLNQKTVGCVIRPGFLRKMYPLSEDNDNLSLSRESNSRCCDVVST